LLARFARRLLSLVVRELEGLGDGEPTVLGALWATATEPDLSIRSDEVVGGGAPVSVGFKVDRIVPGRGTGG
jgi:hypothetical protein